jgi:hypothetical protein
MRAFTWVAIRKKLAVGLVGLLALAASAALTLATGVPEPQSHDEFSYLLAADTFAHGRLTNPTHSMWEHFESYHIIQQPTYTSKYPPGQGLVLAAGQVLGGHPIVGVWLSMVLACAAICWMLQAWVPPRWALFGGLLATFQLVFFGRAHVAGPPGYWSQSYWGGAVAACGGALLFGGLRRLIQKPQALHALLLALGLAILANSRPLEGLVVSLPAAALLVGWLFGKHGPPLRLALVQTVLPIGLVLSVTAAAMAVYNYRVTGDALLMPYDVHERQYGAAPLFLWQTPGPEPVYRHDAMREFHVSWELDWYRRQLTLSGWALMSIGKAKLVLNYYLPNVVMIVPWLALGWTLRNRWMQFALLTCALLAFALVLTTFASPHYAAPIACLIFVLVVHGMRQLRLWCWRGRPLGRFVFGAVPAVCLALLALSFFGMRDVDPQAAHVQRARIAAQLESQGDSHLIVVRDGRNLGYDSWVYNQADIDGSKVVWAREIDEEHNRRLVAYFKDRQIWLLNSDRNPASLVPYAVPVVNEARVRLARRARHQDAR